MNNKSNSKNLKKRSSRKMPIRKKITIAMITAMLMSVAIIVALTFPSFEHSISETVKAHLFDEVENKADDVIARVNTYNGILTSFSQDQTSVGLLISDMRGEYSILQNILDRDLTGFLETVLILNADGDVVSATDESLINSSKYALEPAVLLVLGGLRESAVSSVLDAGSGQERIITVNAVRDAEKKVIGAVAGLINYRVFDRIIDNIGITGFSNDNVSAFIMDKNGMVFGHTSENKIGTKVDIDIMLDILSSMENGEVVTNGNAVYSFNGENRFLGYYIIPSSKWIVCLSVGESEITGPVRQREIWSLLIIVVLCVGVSIFTVRFTNVITRPITVTNSTLSDLAKLDFRLATSYRNYTERNDETGEMCASICSVVDNLRDEMLLINNVSDELEKNTMNNLMVIDHLKEFEETVEKMDKMTEDIQKVLDYTKEMNDKIEDSVESTNQLRQRSHNLKKITAAADKNSTEIFNEVKQTMDAAIEQAKAVDKISIFTDTIMSISRQTNILALNASIESTRAGEAGKGFEVVAEEITNLSKKTTESARSITGIVREIYDAVYSLEDCLKKSLAFVEDQVIPDYRKISGISEEYHKDVKTLSEAAKFLQSGVRDFTAIMQETVDSIVDVGGSVNQNASYLTAQTNKMVDETSKISERLKSTVDKYML